MSPLIGIPKDDEDVVYVEEGKVDSNSIRQMMNLPSWRCDRCGLTNHGLNQKCADFKCRVDRVN